MSTTNPITPPPELVQQWLRSHDYLWGPLEQASVTITTNRLQNVATQAARWGSDQCWRHSMTNPYHAMCAELHTAIQLYTGQNPAAANVPPAELVRRLMDAMAASAALLAQPEPVGPSDERTEEAAKLIHASMRFAVPANHRPCDWVEHGNSLIQDEARRTARAVLARWGHPAPQPVAVSERLPRPEDCDTEDSCWWFDPDGDGAWYVDTFQSCYNHWLPANALPTPEATNG